MQTDNQYNVTQRVQNEWGGAHALYHDNSENACSTYISASSSCCLLISLTTMLIRLAVAHKKKKPTTIIIIKFSH